MSPRSESWGGIDSDSVVSTPGVSVKDFQGARIGLLDDPTGNYRDSAVAKSFFQLLKREWIKRRICASRDEARAEVFDCIEMFTLSAVAMVTTTVYRPYSMRRGWLSGSGVTRKVGVMQF